jgi:membrane protein required for colicin V production
MAAIDLVIIAIVVVSALIGLARGLLKEILSLASWLAAFILALYFAPELADRMTGLLADQGIRLVTAFVVIFVVTLIVGGLIQRLVSSLVKSSGLTGTDRVLGFVFGAARGALLCVVALIAVRRFAETGQWWESSILVPQLLAFEQQVLDLMGRAQAWIVELVE